MNDDQIIEQIRDEVAGIVIGSGYYSTAIGIDEAREVATAVLPIVKAAQAEAWDEGRDALALSIASPLGDNGMRRSPTNPYTEQEPTR